MVPKVLFSCSGDEDVKVGDGGVVVILLLHHCRPHSEFQGTYMAIETRLYHSWCIELPLSSAMLVVSLIFVGSRNNKKAKLVDITRKFWDTIVEYHLLWNEIVTHIVFVEFLSLSTP